MKINRQIELAVPVAVLALVMTIGSMGCSPKSKEPSPSPSPAASPTPQTTPTPSTPTPSTPGPSTPAPTTEPEATPEPKEADGGDAPMAQGGTGTVKITAVFTGATRPKRVVINMAADVACVKANAGKNVGNANLIVNKDMTARNVVCFVKDLPTDQAFKTPDTKALLDQKGCMYDPHVQTVMTGQLLTVRNSDPTLHNIHTFAEKQRSQNFAQPQQGNQRDIDFKRSEFVKIKCDVHPWMSAFVAVFDHPYHAVTGSKGTCTLELPAGSHTIGVWHEETGEVSPVPVVVQAGQETEIEVKIPDPNAPTP